MSAPFPPGEQLPPPVVAARNPLGEGKPRWPAWYGFAALALSLILALFVSGILFAILAAAGGDLDADDPGVTISATLIQDALLAGTALWLAAKVARPRAWHFGLRGTRFWRGVKWAAIAFAIYFVFQIIYVSALDPDQQQTTLEDLGAGDSAGLTILIGILVVGLAPAIEEFFFRGFFYGALRTRYSFVPAALLNGVVFGAIHAPTGIEAVPPLIALGFAFCLAYEATGSILPCIGLHTLNNMVAFGADEDGSWAVGGAVAAVVLVSLIILPLMRRAAPTTLIAAVAVLALAVPAYAQEPPPAAAPAPAPSTGRMKLSVPSATRSEGRSYFLTGQNATVAGTVTPYVAGESVRVEISTPKRKPTIVNVRVRQATGGGAFKVRFKIRRGVRYAISAVHEASDKQVAFSAKAAAYGVRPGTHPGMGVALFKQGLRSLGYAAGNGTRWDDRVARAVMAFRKTNSLGRSFSPTHKVFERVFAGRGAYKLRYPGAGKHVEVDLSRQVLVLAQGDKPLATYHTSSGAPVTPTILGRYRFYMKQPGTNAKQMYMSSYFIRGYAIHGFPSVPTYPASHGCLRVPNADAVSIFNWIRIGDPIYVYR